jgi:hypothetical protein
MWGFFVLLLSAIAFVNFLRCFWRAMSGPAI